MAIHSPRATRGTSDQALRSAIEALERRQLLCGIEFGHSLAHRHAHGPQHHAPLGTFDVDGDGPELPLPPESGSPTPPAGPTAAANVPLSGVPALNSRSSAAASLYLDFVGDDTFDWGGYHPGHTPALDQDGDPTTFSPAELSTINTAWAAVAEDYSPFNLNVTTVDPGNLDNFKTMKVVIGGTGSWYGQPAGGVSFVGSFSNSLPNVAFVFINSNANFIGAAISHEAGHGFGLQHQSAYDAGGNKTDEYYRGDGISAPIMGYGYAPRNTWWQGPDTLGSTTIQDDVSVIADASNGFGYRPDDFPNVAKAAAPLSTIAGSGGTTSFTASGVVEKNTDQDWFSFTIGNGGSVTASANVAQYADLDARLELRDSSANLLTYSDGTSLGETLTATLSPGTYRLGVMSHRYSDGAGGYFTRKGDIGQYTVVVTPPAAPQQAPYYGQPFAVSSAAATTIQLEDFDKGGEGISFHDTTVANTGGFYRASESVDIKPASDGTTGYRLADVFAGEWTEYTIDVADAGNYTLDFRVASPAAGAKFHAAIDGANVTGALSVPNTGGWSHYGMVTKTGVNLTAGTHVLRVAFDSNAPSIGLEGGFDWVRLSKTVVSSTVTLNNTTGAFVRNGNFANTNYGSAQTLEIKNATTPGLDREAYLKFDLSTISSITSATLRFFARTEDTLASNLGIGVYGLLDPASSWLENSITWNNRPASSTTSISTTTVSDSTARWYTLDLTAYLKSQLAAGRTSATLVLKMPTLGGKRVYINSDDAASNQPQLQIKT